MFGDGRYYEFLCFDVQQVVRSPGYDHGHDEESLTGRDIKIDILDGYISDTGSVSGDFGENRNAGRVTGTPRGSIGP